MKVMKTIEYKDWAAFHSRFLLPYAKLSFERQRQLVFRGHANADWSLATTLDRASQFTSADHRKQVLRLLIEEFRRQTRGLPAESLPLNDLEWELLGRHHGLPTTVLDFTRSPYVAAYFAFADSRPESATTAAIWALDRQVFDDELLAEFELIDDDEKLRFNPRAIEQGGLFVKIGDVTSSIEARLGSYLQQHVLPVSTESRRTVLSSLQSMLITARRLFPDYDGAARSASNQVFLIRGV